MTQQSASPTRMQVNLLVTCLVDTLFPQVGEAVVKVLNTAGCKVNYPSGQTCCGQPAYNAGLWTEARQMAQHTIKCLEEVSGPVVVPSGSCTAMIRHGYPSLFSEDPDREEEGSWAHRAKTLAERTFEFSEFLVDVCHQVDFGAVFPGPVTYHASCHLLRGLGIHRQPLALLGAVQDARFPDHQSSLELIEMPHHDECCGFGGVFSVEHAQISSAMLARKLDNIQKTGSQTVVCCDAGCLANISGGVAFQNAGKSHNETPVVLHIAEVLALRAAPPTGGDGDGRA